MEKAVEFEWCAGNDLRLLDVVPTWFMPGGATICSIKPCRGPLVDLFPDGASVVEFTALTRSGRLFMTVSHGDRFQRLSR
jgi:hypothetical protein